MSIEIKNYLVKKSKGRTRIVLSEEKAVVSIQKFDDETETWNWKELGKTNVPHLNDLITKRNGRKIFFSLSISRN